MIVHAADLSESTVSRRSPQLNSDDERSNDKSSSDELEAHFIEVLSRERGLQIRQVNGDGNCLFRAVAFHVYSDEDMHGEVRRLCLDYLQQNRDHFSQFITEDFDAYLERKRCLNVHGNHLEIQAISEIFGRPVEIYEYSTNNAHGATSAPIRLSYHDGCHYNVVYDPDNSTFGVGLGLPGPEPGFADHRLLEESLQLSEAAELERVMLQDKMRLTDFQHTEEEIAHQVKHASYLEFVHAKQRRSPQRCKGSAAHSGPESRPRSRPDAHPSTSNSPRHGASPSRAQIDSNPGSPRPGPSGTSTAASTSIGLYEELLAMQCSLSPFGANARSALGTSLSPQASDDNLLAQAMLLSRQDYEQQLGASSSKN